MSHRRRADVVRALLVAVALLPFAPRLLQGVSGLSGVARACEGWFSFQCQRDPGRSLRLLGQILPVCARCSGIYFGLGLGALLVRPRLNAQRLGWWVALAGIAMLLDVLSEAYALRPAWAALRLLSGLALSYPLAVALVQAARAETLEPGSIRSRR